MSSGRLTLAQQLKQLHEAAPVVEADPESAYSSLTSLPRADDNAEASSSGRDHYVSVGRSKIRDTAASTFDALTAKYLAAPVGKEKAKRVKIFDDDDEEEEEEEEEDEDMGYRGRGMGEIGEEGMSGSGSEDEDDEDEEDEEDDEEEDEEDDEEEEDEPTPPTRSSKPTAPTTTSILNPLPPLALSRQKDILKGLHIQRQQKLFDELLTVRITMQKAVTWAGAVEVARKRKAEEMEEEEGEGEEAEGGEVEERRRECLRRLGELSEGLFELREALALPNTTLPPRTPQRLSTTASPSYWLSSLSSSLSLTTAQHPQTLSILSKWSTKISSATLHASTTKSAFTKQETVIEQIDAGLAAKARGDGRAVAEIEEGFYKSLLREVIESRSGGQSGGAAGDLEKLRKEKKKLREAERGGSKGRRLRYTVHEKAQNFTVPIALEGGWHDEQVDELFGSLLGGAGVEGTAGEARAGDVGFGGAAGADMGMEMEGGVVGGLRVF